MEDALEPPTPAPAVPPRRRKRHGRRLEADRVFTDHVKDFENGRTYASQVWKLQPMHAHFMEKTVPECLFYGKNGTKNHVLWKFVVLYGNFMSFLWKFVVLYGNFVSFYGNLL